MSVYAVALINISDRDTYANYSAGFMDIFIRYGGKLLAVDEAPVVKEGSWPYTRTVLLEFESAEALDAWYHSAEYQALAQHRYNASTASIAVLQAIGNCHPPEPIRSVSETSNLLRARKIFAKTCTSLVSRN